MHNFRTWRRACCQNQCCDQYYCTLLNSSYSYCDVSYSNRYCSFQTSGIPFTTAVSSTGFTPIFTPTSLANLEQTFANLTQQSGASNFVSRESGFVPPAVISEASSTPPMPVMVQIKSEIDYDTDHSSFGSESEYGASAAKRARYGEKSSKINIPDIDPNTYLVSNSRRPTGPRRVKKDEKVSTCVLVFIKYS